MNRSSPDTHEDAAAGSRGSSGESADVRGASGPIEPGPVARPRGELLPPRGMPPSAGAPDDQSARPTEDEPEPNARRPRRRRALVQLAGVILLLLLGAAIGGLLYWQKASPRQTERYTRAAPVQVVRVELESSRLTVVGHGTVRARERLELTPQVAGRVIAIHPDLAAGSFLRGGETIVRIDPTDFELALERARAARSRLEAELAQLGTRQQEAEAGVASAEAAFRRAQARSEVAINEYRELYPGEEPPPLAARLPQVEEAAARLDAAVTASADVEQQREAVRAQIAQAEVRIAAAKVNLDRTRITLPDSPEGTIRYRVIRKAVSVGDAVRPGRIVAEVFRADTLEVVVPVASASLQWIDLPAPRPRSLAGADNAWEAGTPTSAPGGSTRGNGSLPTSPRAARPLDGPAARGGARARIIADYAGDRRVFPGEVVRLEGEVDPATRLVPLVVSLRHEAGDVGLRDELPVGAFVEVRIEGERIEDAAALPPRAIRGREKPHVWIVKDGTLAKRDVKVVRRGAERTRVTGLSGGERVITSRLDAPIEGMAVEVAGGPGVRATGEDASESPGPSSREVSGDA